MRPAPSTPASASTMRSRIARHAGGRPTATPISDIRPSPSNQVSGRIATSSCPPLAVRITGRLRRASTSPHRPPSDSSRTDSDSTSASTVGLLKPMVLSTASSGMRSRMDCAMVLPVSSSRVKNTAPMMAVTIRPMSPICLAKERWKSRSPWVLVSSAELANSRSMAWATCSARSGSLTFTMYQPTVPWPNRRPSSK